MILESRSLLFTDRELLVAMRPILEAKGFDPDMAPTSVVPEFDENGDVQLRYDRSDGDPIIFNNREVGAALLNHCIVKDIPLPRGSYKELAIRGDLMALIVRMETGDD